MDDPTAEGPPAPHERRYPSTIGGALYLVVLLGVAVGLGVVVLADWRLGTSWVGGSLVFAAGCRLLLPGHHAGMLAVRHRLVDAGLLTLVGILLVVLAASIPDQRF